ncbi:MAG: hypothetical protein ACYC1C_20270 [Chloroflexota bacterium]
MKMLYSEMSAQQRELLLDNLDNYPLRVSFLGKSGLLSAEGVALLRKNNVDFDLDDRQARNIILGATVPKAPWARPAGGSEPRPDARE